MFGISELLLITAFCTLLYCESLSYGCVISMHFLIQLDAADSSCNSFSWLCLATHNLLVAGISEWVFLMIIHTIKLSWCNLIGENYLNVTLTWFPYKGSVRQIECPFYQNRRITNQPKAWWIVNLQKEASYSFGSYAGLSFNETGYKWGLLTHDRRIYFFTVLPIIWWILYFYL